MGSGRWWRDGGKLFCYCDLYVISDLSIESLNFTEMKTIKELTAIIEREGDGYVALCPEFDVASQGDTIEEARLNLIEALELFYETASEDEIARRFHEEVLITRVQIAI